MKSMWWFSLIFSVTILFMLTGSITVEAVSVEAASAEVGTSFTYHGHVTHDGSPVNQMCDFEFKLYDAASGGTQISSTYAQSDVRISNGEFATPINFGAGVFDGNDR